MARQSAQTLFDNEYYKFITNANSLLLESLENCELTNEANGARKSKHELQYLGKSSIETGSFVYLFGLFEQFLNASIIIFAKSRLKRGEAYFQVFRREASKRNANGDDSFYKAGLISKGTNDVVVPFSASSGFVAPIISLYLFTAFSPFKT